MSVISPLMIYYSSGKVQDMTSSNHFISFPLNQHILLYLLSISFIFVCVSVWLYSYACLYVYIWVWVGIHVYFSQFFIWYDLSLRKRERELMALLDVNCCGLTAPPTWILIQHCAVCYHEVHIYLPRNYRTSLKIWELCFFSTMHTLALKFQVSH